jgi:uncharacterized membrane protein
VIDPLIFWLLLIAAVPFVLPVVSLVSQARLRRRVREIEAALESQRETIDDLRRQLRERPQAPAAAPAKPPEPVAPPVPAAPKTQAPPAVARPAPPPPSIPPPRALTPPEPPRAVIAPPPPAPPPPPEPPRTLVPFDWEDLVGVKLFSAVAGVALVLAAIFFLKYSIDHGWLSPPIRVAIGVIVATTLLVVCELKAARRYRVTANALDAAAIAILFSTFFAAHALWQLIPSAVAFGLLVLVTVLAVLLSIRRESIFIAVLGLLGGFATPALLSAGENRPISLFTYLLLLNIGLAWVGAKKRWHALTILTIVLTVIYQWGWVIKFLDESQLSLAMGIFLVFSVVSFAALALGRRDSAGTVIDLSLSRAGVAATAMPLVFAVFLAAVPQYGAHTGLLFGFLAIIDAALLAVAIATGNEMLHVIGAIASVLACAIWLGLSYSHAGWKQALAGVSLMVVLYATGDAIGARVKRPFRGIGGRAAYAAPVLLFFFPVVARIEPAAAAPFVLFATLFALLAIVAWRALATSRPALYFMAAFLAVVAEGAWSATHLTVARLGAAVAMYAAFSLFYLGVPLLARRFGRAVEPSWAGGAVLIGSLLILLQLAVGPHAAAALWGLALLLAILNAGLFIESASGRLPMLAIVGGTLSWIVLGAWWDDAAGIVGVLPSLIVVVGLALVMLAGHAWSHRALKRRGVTEGVSEIGFGHGAFLGLVCHVFLVYMAANPVWSSVPWPLLASLAVVTLAVSAASLAAEMPQLHAAGVVAAAVVLLVWAGNAMPRDRAVTAMLAAEILVAYSLAWIAAARRGRRSASSAVAGALGVLFLSEFVLIDMSAAPSAPPLAVLLAVHAANLATVLTLAWKQRWPYVAPAAVIPAWLAAASWQSAHSRPTEWRSAMVLTTAMYAVFAAYPFVLDRRARTSRDPYLTAVAGNVFFFFAARSALVQGGLSSVVGVVPIVAAVVMALLLRELLRIQPVGKRDLARLAFVAGAALGFATVAIPLQLKQQWITIGWALEGAALCWLYRRIPHRGLFYSALALVGVVFGRLALNPSIFMYEPRGMRIFNWYLYAYLTSAVSMLAAAWWLAKTDDRLPPPLPRASTLVPAGAVIVLFILLNIEIADFYASGPEITFRFGVTLAQDLTYTIAWLFFGLLLLTAGIYLHSRPGRVTAVVLIAVTTCKAFLYDLGSLGGLYRVGSLVGLAVSLSLVAVALQKFVFQSPKEAS